MFLSPDRLEAAYRAAGGLTQHHVELAVRSLTGGLSMAELEALHAAALGRPLAPALRVPVADAWRMPGATSVPAALHVAYRAIAGSQQ